jgi:cytochrome c6
MGSALVPWPVPKAFLVMKLHSNGLAASNTGRILSKGFRIIDCPKIIVVEDELVEHAARRFHFLTSIGWLLIATLAVCPLGNAQASSGAATFKSKCALCHGADGTGNTTLGKQLQAANLSSKEVQKKTDAELHKTVHDGNGNMPPFGEQLSDDEITQVIKYVRHFGKTAKK